MQIQEIETLAAFRELGSDLKDIVVQGVDFSGASVDWSSYSFEDTVFLGCRFDSRSALGTVVERGGLVFPSIPGLPYEPYRNGLYTPEELHRVLDGDDRSYDEVIYRHFEAHGRHEPHILEALAQRIHDHAIDDALRDVIDGRKVVGIMGGHSTPRDDRYFRKVAELARLLTLEGYFVASGGGPGIMEAANLGAYFAAYDEDKLHVAIDDMADAPGYDHPAYHDRAAAVRHEYPDGADSLAIPTWFYGHEPSNLFGTKVAKYFSNSIREDGLLAISLHGVVYAPGSAGTTQEIFMDATQNHYGTFGWYSPMVFLGKERYKRETLIYPLIEQLAWDREYYDFLHITDDPADARDFIADHPPREV